MSNKAHKTTETENLPAEQKTTGTELQVYDFGDDAGAGMEDVRREEIKIPFLTILDPKSPQCKPKSSGGAGLKAGDIYNTATGESYSGEAGIDLVLVKRDENYPEFVSRKEDGSGGGFVGIRAADDPLVAKLRGEQGRFGRLRVPPPNGGEWTPGVDHELTQTYYLYALMITPEGTPQPVLIGFKSTQISKYQQVITRQNNISYPTARGVVKPPLWAHVWHFSTRYEEKKGGGQSWYGWVVGLKKEPSRESLLKLDDPLYIAAKEFNMAIAQGTKKADYAAAASHEAQDTEEIPM